MFDKRLDNYTKQWHKSSDMAVIEKCYTDGYEQGCIDAEKGFNKRMIELIYLYVDSSLNVDQWVRENLPILPE